MKLNEDQKDILRKAVETVNTASRVGYHKQHIVFENGVILTLEAKSPALLDEEDERQQ